MPIFDYRCRNCARTYEQLVSRADETVTCPECGAESEKLLSAFAAPSGHSGGGDACACYPAGGG